MSPASARGDRACCSSALASSAAHAFPCAFPPAMTRFIDANIARMFLGTNEPLWLDRDLWTSEIRTINLTVNH